MFGDYEDELLEKMEKLTETVDIHTIFMLVDMTEAEALTKLIMDGHIDEEDLPTSC
jgi:hypothetical protein